MYQPEAMMARHDAVAWGFARMADAHGVDILQNCEVTGIRRDVRVGVTGVETTRGFIEAGKVGMAVAGSGSVVAAMAGIRLPDGGAAAAGVGVGAGEAGARPDPGLQRLRLLHDAVGQG